MSLLCLYLNGPVFTSNHIFLSLRGLFRLTVAEGTALYVRGITVMGETWLWWQECVIQLVRSLVV